MRRMILPLTLILASWSSTAKANFDYQALRDEIFTPKQITGLRGMQDAEYYTVMQDSSIVQFRYSTGQQVKVLFDARGNAALEGFSDYALSADERWLLLTTELRPIYRRTFTADYWVVDLESGVSFPLSAEGQQQVASFSPEGSHVAFVKENDLYVVELRAPQYPLAITTDGSLNHIINGAPDWVYEEEFALARGYEWSPDGRSIAYLRFDQSRVKEYSMTRFRGALYPENYIYKYPKAGEENSRVELFRYDLSTGHTVPIEVGAHNDQYIPRIAWTPAGQLLAYRLNRAQNHFQLLLADRDGSTRPIYEERNERYIEGVNGEYITFLPDGDQFVVRSEKDGFFHLYCYSIERGFLHPITSGEWEVVSVLGIHGDRIYYTSTETSPLKRDLYTIGLHGEQKQRLTDGRGTYTLFPSRGFRYLIAHFSNHATPLQINLLDANGELIRVLEENRVLQELLQAREVPLKEFFTFTNSQGVQLNGYLIKPRDFDSTRCYPVLMTQYSGPGSQRVTDSWSMGWEDVLVQRGYVVACVDGRGTGGRGAAFKKCTYRALGKLETQDQIEAAHYLGTLPYIDAGRIGIYGWSFGGFMALNCILKGSDHFKLAIAVAPVTTWRYYDTIYTELYNGDPHDNPSGYDDYSPLNFADRLQGKLLIAHGTADDNVHIQHTYEMISALTAHNKEFESCIYPDQNHRIAEGKHHLMERCLKFVQENL